MNDAQSHKIPNLIVPGFPKSGTSSLHEYLNMHPDIEMSSIKEPHNYSKKDHYIKRFDDNFEFSFNNIFHNSNQIKYRGESSTSYMVNKKSPQLIFEDNPNIKFIIIARDPIDRIISHYNWLLSLGEVNKSFQEEIEDWILPEFDITQAGNYGFKFYTEFSKYGEQLQRYLNYFSLNNIHIISSENLISNPIETINSCFEFLELPTLKSFPNIVSNSTKEKTEKYKIPTSMGWLQKHTPQGVKKIIKKSIGENLKKEATELYIPTKKEINWLKELLLEDIVNFKKLSGNNFNEWKYF